MGIYNVRTLFPGNRDQVWLSCTTTTKAAPTQEDAHVAGLRIFTVSSPWGKTCSGPKGILVSIHEYGCHTRGGKRETTLAGAGHPFASCRALFVQCDSTRRLGSVVCTQVITFMNSLHVWAWAFAPTEQVRKCWIWCGLFGMLLGLVLLAVVLFFCLRYFLVFLVCLFVYLFVCLLVCLFVCLFVYCYIQNIFSCFAFCLVICYYCTPLCSVLFRLCLFV